MNSKLPKKYYFIPIIYVILILGFMNLHLQDISGRIISKSIGPVTVRYHQESGVRQQLSRITIFLDGLSADLSAGVPVEDATGRSDRIPIRSVQSTQNGFQLVLARGGSLELMVRDGTGGFAILYHKDVQDGNNFFPIITFSAPPEIEVRSVHRALPLIELRRDSGSLLLVHNNSLSTVAEGIQLAFNSRSNGMLLSHVAASNGLSITGFGAAGDSDTDGGSDGGSSAAGNASGSPSTLAGFIAAPLPENSDPLAYWYFGGEDSPSSAAADSRAQQAIDNMLSSWQRSPNQADGRAVSAAAAESLADRGSLGYGALQSAVNEAVADSSWFAATFVDNIVNAEQSYSAEETQLIQEISRLIDQNPEQLLSESVKGTNYPELLSAVVFSGDRELERQLDQTLSDLDVQASDNSAAAAGLFIAAVEALDLYPERFSRLADSALRAYEKILVNIYRIEAQLVYRSFSNGKTGSGGPHIVVDPLVQVKLARALKRFGELSGASDSIDSGNAVSSGSAGSESGTGAAQTGVGSPQSLALRLGNSLLVSAVSFADDRGALPAEITASAEGLVPSDSRVSPSRIYPFLTENNYYPRVVSLEQELGQNIRLWTSAQAVGAVQRPDGFDVTLDFAAGETHYLVMRGVEPFEGMDMYGQPWNGDWRFQTYEIGGWFYNREEQTLFTKIRHRDKIERLNFY